MPSDLNIHLVLDNYATHKHPKIKNWLAAHSQYQVHDMPTYASWLNQVEIWVNLITQRPIPRGTFKSAKDLVSKVDHLVKVHNSNIRLFLWTATADSMLEKLICRLISGTQHEALMYPLVYAAAPSDRPGRPLCVTKDRAPPFPRC